MGRRQQQPTDALARDAADMQQRPMRREELRPYPGAVAAWRFVGEGLGVYVTVGEWSGPGDALVLGYSADGRDVRLTGETRTVRPPETPAEALAWARGEEVRHGG
jgi:hypothetical protein